MLMFSSSSKAGTNLYTVYSEKHREFGLLTSVMFESVCIDRQLIVTRFQLTPCIMFPSPPPLCPLPPPHPPPLPPLAILPPLLLP